MSLGELRYELRKKHNVIAHYPHRGAQELWLDACDEERALEIIDFLKHKKCFKYTKLTMRGGYSFFIRFFVFYATFRGVKGE